MTIISFLIILLSLAAISKAALVSQSEQDGVVSGTLPLITNAQNQLIGNISVGYPPQIVTVIFNISASNLIIYGSGLQTNPSISVTIGPTNNILATSSVAIAGLNITDQKFILTLNTSPYPNIGGVFGLGYTEADIDMISSPLYNIIAQNPTMVKLFSIELPLMGTNYQSELYLGSMDTSLNFTKWVYPDGVNTTDWHFNVTTNYINGTAVSDNSTTYLSTTSSAIAVPDAIFTTLQQYLDIQANASGDYMLACDTVEPIFTFYLNNTNLTLLASDFMMLSNDDSQDNSAPLCVFNIQNSGSDVWILGTPFLAKYNTYFDVGDNRIGFGTYTYEDTTTMTPETSPMTTPAPPATTTEGNAAMELFTRMMYQKILCVLFILLMLR